MVVSATFAVVLCQLEFCAQVVGCIKLELVNLESLLTLCLSHLELFNLPPRIVICVVN